MSFLEKFKCQKPPSQLKKLPQLNMIIRTPLNLYSDFVLKTSNY